MPLFLVKYGRYIVLALVALGLVALIVGGVKGCKQIDADETNQSINIGETVERERTQAEVINRVEKANDAVINPTVNELNVVCEKYDRNCTPGRQ